MPYPANWPIGFSGKPCLVHSFCGHNFILHEMGLMLSWQTLLELCKSPIVFNITKLCLMLAMTFKLLTCHKSCLELLLLSKERWNKFNTVHGWWWDQLQVILISPMWARVNCEGSGFLPKEKGGYTDKGFHTQRLHELFILGFILELYWCSSMRHNWACLDEIRIVHLFVPPFSAEYCTWHVIRFTMRVSNHFF